MVKGIFTSNQQYNFSSSAHFILSIQGAQPTWNAFRHDVIKHESCSRTCSCRNSTESITRRATERHCLSWLVDIGSWRYY